MKQRSFGCFSEEVNCLLVKRYGVTIEDAVNTEMLVAAHARGETVEELVEYVGNKHELTRIDLNCGHALCW